MFEQGGDELPQIGVGKAGGQQSEQTPGRKQSEHAGIAERQGTGALALLHRGSDDRLETIRADGSVMAESLNVEQTSVGGEAALPPGGQMAQLASNGEIVGVVDGGFGAQRPAFLVVLLDLGVLVLGVEGGYDAFGQRWLRKLGQEFTEAKWVPAG